MSKYSEIISTLFTTVYIDFISYFNFLTISNLTSFPVLVRLFYFILPILFLLWKSLTFFYKEWKYYKIVNIKEN